MNSSTMIPSTMIQDIPGRSALDNLAEKLVRRLGVKDALRVCRENSWHGVLRVIQGRKIDGEDG